MFQPNSNSEPDAGAAPRRGISLRAVFLGLILLPINAYFITQLEIVRFEAFPSVFALTMNTLFVLLALTVLNLPLMKWRPRWALSPGELITVYVMLNIGTVLAGQDQLQIIIYTVTYPLRNVAQGGFYADLAYKYLPAWAIVNDPQAIKGFFYGGSDFFGAQIYRAWLSPALVWGGCLLLVFWIMLCINVILRKQWTERERLTFPLVQVPLALVSGTSFFRNKMLWLGLAISSFIALGNGLNYLFPMLPAVIPPDARSFSFPAPTEMPWQAIGGTAGISGKFIPYIISLTMLMPTDLAFSCWFFFWVHRLEEVVSAASGFTGGGQPYVSQQAVGALIGVSLFVLWNERRYLWSVARKALGRPSDLDDSREPLSYRTALLGILLGVAALSLLAWQLGLSLRIIWLFLLIYFVIAIGITRLRSELGAPVHDLFWVGPESYMFQAVGSSAFTPRDIGGLRLFYFLSRSYGGHPMPAQMEAYKMGDRFNLNQRKLSWVLLLAALVGVSAAFIIMASTLHQLGAGTTRVSSAPLSLGREQFEYLQYQLATPEPPSPGRLGATFGGMLFAFVLLGVRLRMVNFPFHPLGFTLGSTWSMTYLWASIFVGWLIKILLLRYGGQRTYLRALPLFFGVILGDCLWGVIWLVAGVLLNRATYSVWWPL